MNIKIELRYPYQIYLKLSNPFRADCIRNGNFFLPKPRHGKENNLYGKRGSKSPRSVVTKEVHTCIMYLHRLGYNKRSLSRILLLHPNTINRVLNKPQDYEY